MVGIRCGPQALLNQHMSGLPKFRSSPSQQICIFVFLRFGLVCHSIFLPGRCKVYPPPFGNCPPTPQQFIPCQAVYWNEAVATAQFPVEPRTLKDIAKAKGRKNVKLPTSPVSRKKIKPMVLLGKKSKKTMVKK